MSNVFHLHSAKKKRASQTLIDAVVDSLTSSSLASKMFHVEPKGVTQVFDEDAGLERIDVPATGRISGQKMRVSFWIKDGKILTSQTMSSDTAPDFSMVKGG